MKNYEVVKGELVFSVSDFETNEEMMAFTEKWSEILRANCEIQGIQLSFSRYDNADGFNDISKQSIDFDLITVYGMPKKHSYVITFPRAEFLSNLPGHKGSFLVYGGDFSYNLLKVITLIYQYPTVFTNFLFYKERDDKSGELLKRVYRDHIDFTVRTVIQYEQKLAGLSLTLQKLTEESKEGPKKEDNDISFAIVDDGEDERVEENLSDIGEDEGELIGIRELNPPRKD